MAIARSLRALPILDAGNPASVPFQTLFDLDKLRFTQINSPHVGFTFLFSYELPKSRLKQINPQQCVTEMTPPWKSRFHWTIHDIGTQFLKRHWKAVRNYTALGQCFEVLALDGNCGWTLDSAGCHLSKFCSAIYNSFRFKPAIYSTMRSLKRRVRDLLGGEPYTCFHANSMICDMYSESKEWQQCMINYVNDSFKAPSFLSEIRNVFIAGQQDDKLLNALRSFLHSFNPHLKEARFFSLSNLNMSTNKRSANDWNDDLYIMRSAYSWLLCGPKYAEAYIGEYWSGFTMNHLAGALIKPRFLTKQWKMLVWGARNPGFPQECTVVNNYFSHMLSSGERQPKWLFGPQWVEKDARYFRKRVYPPGWGMHCPGGR